MSDHVHLNTGSSWTHRKVGGEYVVVGVARRHSRSKSLDEREEVVYRDMSDLSLHTRSLDNWKESMVRVDRGHSSR